MLELNQKILQATNEVFKRLNILRRWTSFVTENKYNELSKQALNCITAYLLASYCENAGHPINWGAFPKIALYRAFQKVYVYFDTHEGIIDDICKMGNIDKEEFNRVTKDVIAENTNQEFMEFISSEIDSYEYRIYKAASKIATYVELVENSTKARAFDEYGTKLKEVLKYLENFLDIPGVSDEFLDTEGNLFKLLQKISHLRNQNRWSVMCYHIECSVLGHLFDTAVFAYYIALEKFPGNEEIATKFFFMGIFHDIAETWTTDIPSPIKDRIPGFREATEIYEAWVIQKHLYSEFPDFLATKVRNVMFEDASNIEYKKLMKGADYLSASSECWRQYKAGSRDEYFLGVMERFNKKLLACKAVELTPCCKEFHDTILSYARSLRF